MMGRWRLRSLWAGRLPEARGCHSDGRRVWAGEERVLRGDTRFPGILNVPPSRWLHWGYGSCYWVAAGR